MSLTWDKQRVTEFTEVYEVAAKFMQANCYQPPDAHYRIYEMLIIA